MDRTMLLKIMQAVVANGVNLHNNYVHYTSQNTMYCGASLRYSVYSMSGPWYKSLGWIKRHS